jgi:hypothetical protein
MEPLYARHQPQMENLPNMAGYLSLSPRPIKAFPKLLLSAIATLLAPPPSYTIWTTLTANVAITMYRLR